MFRRKDYLHSGGVGCGSTSADGNESSPHPVYENGNALFMNGNVKTAGILAVFRSSAFSIFCSGREPGTGYFMLICWLL